MKRLALASLLAGLTLAAALLLHFGLAEVGAALKAAGALGLLSIAAIHFAAMALMGVAWWLLAGGRGAVAGPQTFVWGRLIRDSGSEVLPLSQVGGYVLGARAIILHGVAAAIATATTVVDVTLELCAQLAYTALGLALLLQLRPETKLAFPILAGLGAAVVALLGFVGVQRRGARLLDRLTAFLAREWLSAVAAGAVAVETEIHRAYARRGGAFACFLLHLAAWIGTAFEAWLALRLMGATLDFAAVLVIESLLYAVRSVAFFVPNAIGIQEGAYVMLGASFGIGPDLALALSLLKRGRDLFLGIPALLFWQFVETRRLWSRRAATPRDIPKPPQAPGAGQREYTS
ncbi:MAG TPA: lysylphosphatidylglycerol synthase domain-containing protein [Stellaceae bacterium]|nr:lysylphosphatidylglycerol synthase domain-containing protein [Stellaceae bacterium]